MDDLKRLVEEAIAEMRGVRTELDQLGDDIKNKASEEDLKKAGHKGLVRDVLLMIAVLVSVVGVIVALLAADSASRSSASVDATERCLAVTQQLQLDRSKALAGPSARRTAADRQVRRWDTVEERVFKRILNGAKNSKHLRHRFSVANQHKLHWESVWRYWDDVYQQRDEDNPVPDQRLCDILVKRLPVKTVTATATATMTAAARPSTKVRTKVVAGPTTSIRVTVPARTVTVTATKTQTVPPGKAKGRHHHHR